MDASRPSQPAPPPDLVTNAAGTPPLAAQAGDVSAPLTEVGPPGRTRPRFEQLAPGPPTWPGWIAIPIGFVAAVAGDAVAEFLLSRRLGGDSPAVGLWVGFFGALVLVGGLTWVAFASIVRRRMLPRNRYRGPSVLVIFAMIELGLPFLLVPPLLAVTGGALETAVERVEWYGVRFGIEVWHKVLKSGCRIETRQLESAERLQRCLPLYSVIAWRILYATLLSRTLPELPCTVMIFAVWLLYVWVPGAAKLRIGAHGPPSDVAVV